MAEPLASPRRGLSHVRVLFFTDGVLSPGSRFRCLQFFAHLEANGIRCEARFAYDERYNSVFAQPWAPLYKLGRRMRRVGHLLFDTDADVIFVHKTALALSGIPEWLRGLGTTPMVFDFDDAIYLGPGGVESNARRRTFEQVAASADALIAGNTHLARVAAHPEKTIVIPSVVDTEMYTPLASSRGPGLVVGWMGTASNFPYLRRVMPSVLKAVARIPGARLRVVSNGTLPEYETEPLVEQWQWRAERELMALRSFDVGLMPLDDSELTRGKCGFKMIQYMSVGVPVVASAVGANIDIFHGSNAGALLGPGDDWGEAIAWLASSRESMRAMGEAGRRHAVANYSVQHVLPQYLELFRRLDLRRSA